ncbi:hypothetical protein [Candidatus Neptunochlamydia vexilliferae]|uniref:hypothetical protein n=1 Tax=Candidatus Neptunichlamydia vexilliferae TaxID=1651774 RepID=UPI001891B0CB|nr:hypothetical protein [Candidatus Neptunochlamydia vexilliferae]
MKRSHPKVEGMLQASKWLSHRVLLDVAEMEELLSSLPLFGIYNVSELVSLDEAFISTEDFLARYIDYISELKAGIIPDEAPLKPYFSAAFSSTADALYIMEAKEGEYIIKTKEPVVQLGRHHFTFSHEQRAFHSMVHSHEAITWGIQFSYPQLYSNSLNQDVVEVYKDKNSPNTALFKHLAKWVRTHTNPAAFVGEDKPFYATFRIGKKCVKWAADHPQLKQAGLTIYDNRNSLDR